VRGSGPARIPLDGTRAITRIWLIRHGEPVAEAQGRCYGSLDFGLSGRGQSQMAAVAQYLATEPLAAICASPLSRAMESAQIVAARQSCPVECVTDLRELDFGNFEGLSYDEIAALHPDLYRQWMNTPTEIRFPNGESFAEMRARVLSAFDAIRREREGQTVAIVSHGGVNRILIAWALQIPDSCIFRLAQDYAAINLITVIDGVPSVRTLNRQPF